MKKLAILALLLVCFSALAVALDASTDIAVGVGKNKTAAVDVNADASVGKNRTVEAGVTASAGAKGNRTGPVAEVNGTLIHVGLSNALLNVENANARAAIEANMQRFIARYQARLGNMTEVNVTVNEETGSVEVRGKEPVRFLGFIKGKATTRFEIENNGQVTVKQPWYRFLYSSETSTEASTQ